MAIGKALKTGIVIKVLKNISDNWMSLVVWALFSIAVIRGLGFIDINFYLYHLLIPGFLFFSYLLYYFLKTGTFLKFIEYLFSIILLSIGFHGFEFLVKTYIRLNYSEGDFVRITIFFLSGIFLASLLYLIVYVIKKVSKS